MWRRHREHFVWDLLNDVSTLFNTVDTTYVQRNRYAGQVQLYNTHFLQLIRLQGTDAEGKSQALTFSPAHTVKSAPTSRGTASHSAIRLAWCPITTVAIRRSGR